MRLVIVLSLVLLGLYWTASARAQGEISLATQAVEEPLQVEPRTVAYTGDGTGYLGGRTTSPGHLDHGRLRWLS